MEKERLFSLLNNTKKRVNVFDCESTFICEGRGWKLGQHIGSALYNSEILFIKDDGEEISVVINVELKKGKEWKNMKVHNLKIKPQYFKDVVSGIKTFEVRKNDRNFKVGDLMVL